MKKNIVSPASIIILLLLALTSISLYGSIPKVLRFSHDEVESGFQDFAIAQDSLLRIYIGNQEGLLRYDGAQWEGFYLPNQSAIRALYCQGDTVFIGGFDEFGYFAPSNSAGQMLYTSLSDDLKKTINNITEIWAITRCNGAIWFMADYWLFEYKDGKVKSYKSKKKLTAMSVYGGRLILGAGDNGLMVFESGQFVDLPSEELTGKYIVDLLPYNGKLLIATANTGLYSLSGGNSIARFETSADNFMHGGNIYRLACSGSQLAIASLSKGICVLENQNGAATYFNNGNGLESNTVYAVFYDTNHNLWAGTDDGITLIVLNSPVKRLSISDNKLGIGYAALEAGDYILLGTSQGLFYLGNDQQIRPVDQLKGYQPPVMSLALIDNELFVGSHDGLYILGKNGSRKVAGVPGTLHIRRLHSNPDAILLSTNDNFYLLEREGGEWKNKGKVSGYSDVNGRFAEDVLGNIWISHWLKGVFRLRLSPDRKKFDTVKLYDVNDGLPDNAGNTLAEIEGRVVFSTRNGMYSFDGTKGKFVPDNYMNSIVPNNPSASLLKADDRTLLSIAPGSIMVSKTDSSGALVIDSISYKSVLPDIVPGYVEMLQLKNGDMLVSSRHGFYSIDPRFKMKQADKPSLLYVDRISNSSDSLLYRISGSQQDDIHISYADHNLKFGVAMPEYRETNAVYYSFFLEGYDKEWSQPTTTPTKEYTKLPPGEYTLHVKAYNKYDETETQTEFNFIIDAPWYLTTLAKIIYALIIILLIIAAAIIIRRISLRAARKVKEREEENLRRVQHEAQMRQLQDQYELEKLKSEQMESNIRSKSEELSNTTMNVIRKNELLNSMIHKIRKTEEILGEKGYNTEAKKNLNALRKLIAENIEHDDDWKKFTDNFDEVYNKFIKRLTSQFPTLTNSEVKICCYIKMGLSSKEISSIFNLSVRSIEMYRYQIRPKLGLSREDRLSTFLQQF